MAARQPRPPGTDNGLPLFMPDIGLWKDLDRIEGKLRLHCHTQAVLVRYADIEFCPGFGKALRKASSAYIDIHAPEESWLWPPEELARDLVIHGIGIWIIRVVFWQHFGRAPMEFAIRVDAYNNIEPVLYDTLVSRIKYEGEVNIWNVASTSWLRLPRFYAGTRIGDYAIGGTPRWGDEGCRYRGFSIGLMHSIRSHPLVQKIPTETAVPTKHELRLSRARPRGRRAFEMVPIFSFPVILNLVTLSRYHSAPVVHTRPAPCQTVMFELVSDWSSRCVHSPTPRRLPIVPTAQSSLREVNTMDAAKSLSLPSSATKDSPASHSLRGGRANEEDLIPQQMDVYLLPKREVRIFYWKAELTFSQSACVPETTIMDATVGKMLNLRRCFPNLLSEARSPRWMVNVWDEDKAEWDLRFRMDAQAKVADDTSTVLLRERNCHVCPAFAREVEIQQIRRGVKDIVQWVPIDLRTGVVPQVFIVTLTNQGLLIFDNFPQLAEHCFRDGDSCPVFSGTRIWDPRKLEWDFISELTNFFPLEGYNFAIVRDFDNPFTAHLGFFLRELEQQTENPVTVHVFAFMPHGRRLTIRSQHDGLPTFVRVQHTKDATSTISSPPRKGKPTAWIEDATSPVRSTPHKCKRAVLNEEATSPVRKSPRQRKLTERGAFRAAQLKVSAREEATRVMLTTGPTGEEMEDCVVLSATYKIELSPYHIAFVVYSVPSSLEIGNSIGECNGADWERTGRITAYGVSR
ncbi:hypothetical protein BD309DRAFT_984973 [Dichomitus squalens]|nr:hypothetical protein BD309DRAFT_984973 [Dichomitus squalens]